MLRSTFLHAVGADARLERNLWRQGALTWEEFLRGPYDVPDEAAIKSEIEGSIAALDEKDRTFFSRRLPSAYRWRAFDEFGEKTAYLDIETDGRTLITVIGVFDGFEMHQYVLGDNLNDFRRDIEQYDLIVTYFGENFDLPMIQRNFPSVFFDQVHIDLCPVLRRLGYKGGLKKVERLMGIYRDGDVDGLDGRAAIRLWQDHIDGKRGALDLLLKYNYDDCANLAVLMKKAYKKLRADTGYDAIARRVKADAAVSDSRSAAD
ncbi:MAG: ribonuclease H-like domain-containing protein [Armatimonadetes bacterium]|nr:ribonuclease H-like domain-containing protein [Armatimonadota bacterium]